MTGFSTALAVLGQFTVVAGALVLVLAAVGLLRFGDVYMRASAVATATGIGISLVITGSLLIAPGAGDAAKAILAVALQLVTSAVGGIVLARSATLSGHRFRPDTASTGLAAPPARDGGGEC